MNKKLLSRVVCIALIAVSTFSVTIGTLAWFMGTRTKTDEEPIDGEVKLRSYFFAGDGSHEHPYEIVKKEHLYNLCYLQNLGVFTKQKEFRIGHNFNGDGVTYECLADDGTTHTEWLDMTNWDYANKPIRPIGNETTPFVGVFDGNGLPVRNLKIQGSPDDVGFFGYVSYEANVHGLIVDNIEIKSTGYSSDSQTDMYGLFNPEVDKIFDGATSFENASLSFTDLVNNKTYGLKTKKLDNQQEYTPDNDDDHVGLDGIGINEINKTGSFVTDYLCYDKDKNEFFDKNGYVYKGYFTPTYPDDNRFQYDWRASSPIIQQGYYNETEIVDDQEITTSYPSSQPGLLIDMKTLADSTGQGSFNYSEQVSFSTRISLYATYHDNVSKMDYSRVIQSYTLVFHSNSSPDFSDQNHLYSLTMYCDYSYLANRDKPNYYSHGNNIGFLAGHLDGRMNNCYVYDGLLTFVGESASNKSPEFETETGLIGEVGVNVINHLDPEYGTSEDGKDRGVLNFSKIYDSIRTDYAVNDIIKAGYNNTSNVNYMCYDDYKYTGAGSKFSLYEPYLKKHNTDATHYVTFTNRSIPAIEDDSDPLYVDDVDPNKNKTTWHNYKINDDDLNKQASNSVTFGTNGIIEDGETEEEKKGLGVFKIILPNAGSNHYDTFGSSRIVKGSDKTKVYFSTAEFDHAKAGTFDNDTWEPFRAYHTPSYTNGGSFDYLFGRDFNYCFELDLSKMNECAVDHYYMWNTKNDFLKNYLSGKLIDKIGTPISAGTRTFGFRFQMKDANKQIISPTKLYSYMPIGEPGSKYFSDGKYYPSKTIAFSIARKANVSVVGNRENISIYKFNANENNNNNTTKVFTMKSKNNTSNDQHRFFTYNVSNGVTPSTVSNYSHMIDDDEALYGHIFKLDPGDYVIGAAKNTANIYFLSVQGQEDGDEGTDEAQVGVGGNELDNVDFLLKKPTVSDFKSGNLLKANLVFRANFNGEGNTLSATSYTPQGSQNKYIKLSFTKDPNFVTYLFTHSYSSECQTAWCYVNNDPITAKDNTYEL